ncbi:MAG: IS66 family insertion sequence element accessory protein TnpB [Acidovorax sp.]
MHIDMLWLCSQPQDMRAGADRLLNIVGMARAHHDYLFANLRTTRIKLLVHYGFGMWCATRRLHEGHFVWLERAPGQVATLQLSTRPFEALTVGLPWQRLGEFSVISRT